MNSTENDLELTSHLLQRERLNCPTLQRLPTNWLLGRTARDHLRTREDPQSQRGPDSPPDEQRWYQREIGVEIRNNLAVDRFSVGNVG